MKEVIRSNIELKLCELCQDCGFLNNSQVGVLKEELGLLEIIDKQIPFMCHKHLLAFNGTENTDTDEYVKTHDSIYICSGFIQSLYKSNIKPKNKAMKYLYSLLKKKEIDKNIMSIDDTIKYHKI